MKRIVSILLILTAGGASALPIGRPIAAEHQWQTGFVASFEEMATKGKNNAQLEGEIHSRLFAAEAVYGVTRGAELVLRLGTSENKYVQNGVSRDIGSQLDWGFGGRGVFYDSFRDWKILLDAQYYSRPTRSYGIADVAIVQWQLAGAVEWHLGEFYPYLGVFYSKARLNSNNQAVIPTVETLKPLGGYIGLGYEPSLDWTVSAEARIGAEKAASVGAHYRF